MNKQEQHIVLDGTVVRPPFSGVQNSVQREIEAELASLSGCRCTVLGLPNSPVLDIARDFNAEALAVVDGENGPLRRICWQQLKLPRLLQKLEATVFHAFAYTAPLRCPCPYVVNVHDIIALERPELCSQKNLWHMRMLMPASVRRAERIIVSTEYVAQSVAERLQVPRKRISVIPLGVDYQRFADYIPRPACVPDKPYILFVGNLEPKKGLDVLLDAYASSPEAQRLNLVIAGRAAWKCSALLSRIRHWAGSGKVVWLDYVPDTVLPGLYQHAMLFVMPSLTEGFGMPVLEAMAAGVPVIHSDHPALMEAAGGCGASFANGDAQSLAAAVKVLLDDPSRQADMVRQGKKRAASCSWQTWGHLAAEVVRSL